MVDPCNWDTILIIVIHFHKFTLLIRNFSTNIKVVLVSMWGWLWEPTGIDVYRVGCMITIGRTIFSMCKVIIMLRGSMVSIS